MRGDVKFATSERFVLCLFTSVMVANVAFKDIFYICITLSPFESLSVSIKFYK